MPTPADPLRLTVINRFVTVLQAITAGATYFYTPFGVAREDDPLQVNGTPWYSVSTLPGGSVADGMDYYFDESFVVCVKGVVQDNSDVVSVREKALRDVRQAIMTDAKLGTVGALGALGALVQIQKPAGTFYAVASGDFYGFFDQEFLVTIKGTWTAL